MKCPFCGNLGDKVVDSRESKEGDIIRRRRECLGCGKRFTSREHIEDIEYRVVKKDGSREPFQRQKLIGGLVTACEKRPVSVQQLEAIADRIESELQDRPEREMTTEEIGARIMEELQAARPGRLRAVRLGLPPVPRRRRVQARDRRAAEVEGMMGTPAIRMTTTRDATRRPGDAGADVAPPRRAPPVPRQPPPDPARDRAAASAPSPR